MTGSRTFMLIVLAAMFAGIAAWLANGWLQQQAGLSEAALREDMQPVVMAALKIPYGNLIETQHVKIEQMPKRLVPDGAATDTAAVIGKIARREMIPGEMIFTAQVAEQLEGSVLAALLGPNMRAVTVRVNDVIGVGGFLLPGNYVDVLATRVENREQATTRTVLQRIKVLAVDQTASTEENSPVVVRSVTLEVDPAQAEILVKSESEGPIQLTLRNPLEEVTPAPTVTQAAPAPVVPKPRIYSQRPTPTVTVIRGVESETRPVRGG